MSYPKSSAGGNLSTAAMGHCHTLTVNMHTSSVLVDKALAGPHTRDQRTS